MEKNGVPPMVVRLCQKFLMIRKILAKWKVPLMFVYQKMRRSGYDIRRESANNSQEAPKAWILKNNV